MSELNDFITNQLKEMGFPEAKIKKALKATKATSVEAAMEWMITHEDDDGHESDEATKPAEGETLTLRPDNVDQEMPKTEEEKAEAKRRYEELIKQRRLEREEKEKQEELEREINRRKSGSELVKLREKMEQEERIRAAEQRRKDKEDDRLHRQQVLEQIKRDREAFNARNNPKAQEESQVKPAPAPAPTAPSVNYDQCRLGIRLPDGSQIVQTFQAKEPLAAVKVYIELNRKDRLAPGDSPGNFNIVMPPNTPFKDEDYERPLQDLGLCPSARLIVSQKKSQLDSPY